MNLRVPHWLYQKRNQQQIIWFSFGLILVILISLLGFPQICEAITQELRRWWSGGYLLFMQMIWSPLSTRFNSFSPSVGFASDVMAYQAAIIAIAIPVSLVIISQISERYQSGVITKEFNRQWQLRALLVLVVIDVLLVVIFKFFVGEKVDNLGWKLVAWLILLIFIATNIVLFAFFNTLRQYTTKTQFLLDRLFDDVQQALHLATRQRVNDKQLRAAQERLASALEGIGDILAFETKKRRNNEPIIASLRRIQDNAQVFFALQESQPDRFLKLLYSHDLLQLGEANDIEASLLLSFSPDKYLVVLMAIVNQFLRLREAGLEAKNLEIARLATYNPLWLAQELSQKNDHHQSIETILRTLSEVRYGSQQSQDDLAHFLSTTCYISPVFKNEFNLTYLGIFTRYFIPGVRGMIDNSRTELFRQLVRTLHDRDVKHYNDYKVEEFQSFLLRIDHRAYIEANQDRQLISKLNRVRALAGQLWTDEQLKECIDAFDELKDFVYDHFAIEQQAEIRKRFDKLYNELIFRFKFNHLVSLMFDVGAYCVFREHYDYVHYLWTFLQPPDADANWLGHTVVPTSLPGLFNLFFRDALAGNTFSVYWEDHRGNRRYYDRYFLLLLLREFLNSRVTTNQERRSLIDSFQLPNGIHSTCLNNVQYKVDRLVPLARDLGLIAASLQILGFDGNQLNDAIEQGVIPFLESLEPKAEERIQQQLREKRISPQKIEEFKSEFLEGYTERASVRNLFKLFNLYEDKANESADDILGFGFKQVDEKEMFFEDWYVNYGHPGDGFGSRLGADEDSRLISVIAQACTIQEEGNLESALELFRDRLSSVFIITVNADSFYILSNSNRFETRGTDQSQDLASPEFSGFYIHADHKIPVFQFFCPIAEEGSTPNQAILVLDREQLGQLIEYAPAEANEPYQIVQHFAFRIQAFAEDEALMTEFLQNPPNWLIEKGSQIEQRTYLESQVFLAIYEKFHLEISSDFSGVLIPLSLEASTEF
jgi:hypothetical protein